MKRNHVVLLPALLLAVVTTPHLSRAQNSGYAVTERGGNYQVWQKTTVEHGTNHVHRYVELATGLNYTNTSGQWVPSREQITVVPQGGAVAVRGQHKVYFPANIYNGVIDVFTPDGRELRSRPLGVSYDDGTNTVFIGTLTNAIGWLVSSNQVIYTNAFAGLKADLLCTYRKDGFECDLVFRQQPPKPAQFGLSNARSTLQLVTEFFNTAEPQQIPAQADKKFGLQDSTLKFGQMVMTQGKAFAVGNSGSQTNLQRRMKSATSVYKRWVHAGGRTFLVEEVPLVHLTNDLSALPLTASAAMPDTHRLMASSHVGFPPSHELMADTNQMLLATADLNRQPGVVLDYDELDSDTDSYTFATGSTYLVSGPVSLGNGDVNTPSVVFQGGTVVKFTADAGMGITLNDYYDVDFEGNPNQPIIFTSKDDDSVGEVIDGSSGQPTVLDQINCLNGVASEVSYLYVYYAGLALTCSDPTVLRDCALSIAMARSGRTLANWTFTTCCLPAAACRSGLTGAMTGWL